MFEPPVDPNSKARLVAINLDEASIGRGNANIEHERRVAIFDILESNRFELEGRKGGPYALDLRLVEDRLVLAIGFEPLDPPSGQVVLQFADGGAIRLKVECIEAELRDLGPVWQAKSKPQHPEHPPRR